jgi:hypothetical protein
MWDTKFHIQRYSSVYCHLCIIKQQNIRQQILGWIVADIFQI